MSIQGEIIADPRYLLHRNLTFDWAGFSEKYLSSNGKSGLDLSGECAWIAANHLIKFKYGSTCPNRHGAKVGKLNELATSGVFGGKYRGIGTEAEQLHNNSYESNLEGKQLKSKVKKLLDFIKMAANESITI